MTVDHALHFCGFDNGVEVRCSFGYLDHFCHDGLAGGRGAGGEEAFVELFEIFAEDFGAFSVVSEISRRCDVSSV